MRQRRQYSRFGVNLPVSCHFSQTNDKDTTQGSISNISLGGMKIAVPLDTNILSSDVDYHINLPAPFNHINGRGLIKWSTSDPDQNQLIFGMAFERLNQKQREELACIMEELSDHN